jgi:2-polyprenyl-3-methyl-5-hydroxy-6-metoxy-1,4-benzoquinol methylase
MTPLHLAMPLLLCLQTATALTSNNLELHPYFQPAYANHVKYLSSTRIVEMMPVASSSASLPLRQQLFMSPLVSTLYERVLPPLWELGLRIGGPDAEYMAAAPHLGSGQACLDLSCGTGFVGRRVAASGTFQNVFGLDYSPQMLQE